MMLANLFRLLLCSLLCPGLVIGESFGTDFITAFPENIAYYHPMPATHRLRITALQNNTQVDIFLVTEEFKTQLILQERHTDDVLVPSSLELQRTRSSFNTVRITSSRPITVLSVSIRANSSEASIVYPVTNLGTSYLLSNMIQWNVTGAMKIIIINTENMNNMYLFQYNQNSSVVLQPYETAQYDAAYTISVIRSKWPVAVLLAHRCMQAGNNGCNCRLVFEQLNPIIEYGTDLVVPEFPKLTVGSQLYFKSKSKPAWSESQMSVYTEPDIPPHYSPGIPALLLVLGPGYLMNILPVEQWASVYLLHSLSGYNNYALLVARSTETDGVWLDGKPLPSSVQWTKVPGTGYSRAVVQLASDDRRQVVFHRTSTIAAYNYGVNQTLKMSYATVALSLTKTKGNVVLVKNETTWISAQQHCLSYSGALVSVNSTEMDARVTTALQQSAKLNGTWIGLRRSVLNDTWYWLSTDPIKITHWATHEPRNDTHSRCTVVSLDAQSNVTWSSQSCCHIQPFICFLPRDDPLYY